ncbi:MAG TPA: GDSL-type esterase/lipase family protein [Thermoplasmata archaeon]|nr:GDSL-type esterase/lipase family protein [Thermoplasmata archaeon]
MARPLRIVGLGDSTIAGTPGFQSPIEAPPDGRGNPESQCGYWMMQAHPEWTVLNRGVNGERSDEIRTRFARDVLEARPDYVIVLAGVNDIFQGLLPEAVERNLGPIYAEAIDAGIVPVAGSVLPYDAATERANLAMHELNHWIESFARILSIPFCDTRAAVADPRDGDRLRGSPDGLHPDVDGYRRMGEALAQSIEGAVEARSKPRR